MNSALAWKLEITYRIEIIIEYEIGENYLQNLKLAQLIQLAIFKKNICIYFNILQKSNGVLPK